MRPLTPRTLQIRTKASPLAPRSISRSSILKHSTVRIVIIFATFILLLGLLRGSNHTGEVYHEGASKDAITPSNRQNAVASKETRNNPGNHASSHPQSDPKRLYPPSKKKPIKEYPKNHELDASTISAIIKTVPDPRWDRIAVAMQSSSRHVKQRVPVVYQAWLSGIRNVVVVGDEDFSQIGTTGLSMIDVIANSIKISNNTLSSTDHSLSDDNEDEEEDINESEDEPNQDPLAQYLKDAERAAKIAAMEGQDNDISDHYARRLKQRSNPVHPLTKKELINADTATHIATVQILYNKFPTADWYILSEDETYIFMENLHYGLHKLNATKPYYFGVPKLFSGCKKVKIDSADSIKVVDSAGGIILSKGAVEQMLPYANICMTKYQGCKSGDEGLGLCLRRAKVTIDMDVVVGPFSANAPGWTAAEYGENECARPISFGHVIPEWMRKLGSIAEKRGSAVLTQAMALKSRNGQSTTLSSLENPWFNVTKKTHPWLYSGSVNIITAIESPHYAPVTMGDLFKSIVEQDPTIPVVIKDTTRPTGTEYDSDRSVLSLDECRSKCVDDVQCRSWEFDVKGLTCRRFKGIPAPEARQMSFSGYIRGRYSCKKPIL